MKPSELELMAYYDGELSPPDRARVEAWLERDQGARARLAEFAALGDAVRTWAKSRAPGEERSSRVVRRAALRESSSTGRRSLRLRVALTLSFAAAAAVGLAAGHASEGSFQAATASPPTEAAPTAVAARASEVSGARVESIDFGDRSGSIFVLGSGGRSTTVIWMNDLPENRRRIESL